MKLIYTKINHIPIKSHPVNDVVTKARLSHYTDKAGLCLYSPALILCFNLGHICRGIPDVHFLDNRLLNHKQQLSCNR